MKVDRYLGIPMCFFATLAKYVFMRPKQGVVPKNILFIELSEMGSAIIVDPAMREAKKRFNGELFFLIFKKNKPSLELLGTVPDEHIFTIDAGNMVSLIKDTFQFLKWAREKKIDTVIDLELFSRFTALLAGFSGADNIVGFYNFHGEGLFRGNMMTREISYNPHIHISKNFMAMINALSEHEDTVPFSKTIIGDKDIILAKCQIQEPKVEKVVEKIQSQYPNYKKGSKNIAYKPKRKRTVAAKAVDEGALWGCYKINAS